jgi:hypothetical protein
MTSREGAGKANPKLGGEILVRINLGYGTSLVPSFFSTLYTVMSLTFDLAPTFWGKN